MSEQKNHSSSQGLQVLGVGLPRTGTASMKAALEILGYPTYHMYVVVANAEHGREWQRIFAEVEAGNESPGFNTVFDRYTAAVDAPAETLWPLIVRENPNVKVILTKRPGPAWKKSIDGTIMRLMNEPMYPLIIFWVDRLWQQGKLAKYHLVPMWLRKYGAIDEIMMDQRIHEVRNSGLPAEQLLEYELGSGWGPLCAFLDKPVPKVEFPFANDKDAFAEFIKGEMRVGLQRWAAVIACAAITIMLVKRWIWWCALL